MNEKTGPIPEETLKSLTDGTLLVDTSLLRGATRFPEQFGNFFAQLGSANCGTVTLPEVRSEFVSGSTSLEEFQAKRELLAKTIKGYESAGGDDFRGDTLWLYVFGRQAEHFNLTSYLLGWVLRQHPDYKLITARHLEFTSQLFTIDTAVNIVTAESVATFVICSYSSEKYLKAMQQYATELGRSSGR